MGRKVISIAFPADTELGSKMPCPGQTCLDLSHCCLADFIHAVYATLDVSQENAFDAASCLGHACSEPQPHSETGRNHA